MWPRISLNDARTIAHYLGVLISFLSIGLAVPLVVAVVFQEWVPASHYVLTAGICLVVGTLLRFVRIQPGRLSFQQALIITGLSWVVLALFAAIPLWLSGHYGRVIDALFDSVSGVTTTGVSIISDLGHLSNADNMWRFVLHATGGLGFIVVGATFGLFGRGGGASLFSSEGRGEHIVPNVVQTARFISKIAAVFVAATTLVLCALCLMKGMEAPRALMHSLWLAISAFVTGGFTPTDFSAFYYHSPAIEFVLMVVMLAGSISFVLHSAIVRGRVIEFFRDMETIATFAWLAVLTVVFAATVSSSVGLSDLPTMLRRDLFTVISAYSTTGFLNITGSQLTETLTSGALLTIAVLMSVGGGTESTSGGIKVRRLAIIVKSIVSTVKQTLSPDSARISVSYYHLGRHTLSPELVRAAMTVTSLYGITYIAGTLVGIAAGYDATQAIFESVAMGSNAGLSAGIASQGMPAPLECFYILQMWAGRLEYVTFIALIVNVAVSLYPRTAVDRLARRVRDR
ncbi:TrkH family potassium uptake protein [Berryella wangjianweii]|uniref:TrkH family potassium uptake protein n=1 Tax=Berryella wangjianweii TaxID=2734634 RepID=A0A6M8IXG3_9ACTN|nr:TrkH family potassium uptake protein [Berryella wangjianweii]NPD31924.1 TrkH family potassium uptake protein [Eggerthellaceae bacterium zg-997]QKF07485.1 TrkH family potassium uptake protein [Berryella wangjianweii]